MTPAQATIALAAQLDRAINALIIPEGNTAHELKMLDEIFEKADNTATLVIIDTTARRLFQQPQVFDNLHFHSSLLSNSSNFFGAVLRRMGDLADAEPALAETAALPVRIRLVEHCRRKGNSGQMNVWAVKVEAALQGRLEKNDTLALGQLAKVRYEQSMDCYNRKEYAKAIEIGEASIGLCQRADDQFGVLAARGGTAGLFRYEWARSLTDPKDADVRKRLLDEGRPVLETDLQTAMDIQTQQESGSLQWKKFARVEMNNAAHLMHIADLQGDSELARRMMDDVLQKNPVFQEAFDPQHPGDPAYAQEWARPYFEILKRLEGQPAKES